VSRRGVLPNTFTFDTCGPMTRTVEDAAIVLGAIAGYDDGDITSVKRPAVDYLGDLRKGVRSLRIGWIRHWYDGDELCHPDVAPAVAQALKVFADAGAIVEEIRLSDLLVYQDCKTTISITEMFSAYEHEFRTRPQDFGLIRRIVSLETPAHVQAQVLTARFPFMVAVSSLVGVDTYLARGRTRDPATVNVSAIGADFLISQPSLDPRLGAGGSAPVLGHGTRPVAVARGPAVVNPVGMFPIDGSESRAWGDKTITRYSWQLLT